MSVRQKKKHLFFFYDGSNLKSSKMMIFIYFCSILNHTKSFFPFGLFKEKQIHIWGTWCLFLTVKEL